MNQGNPPAQTFVPKTPQDAKLFTTLTKMVGDMRFVGLVLMISGIVSCLSIVGAIFGVPSIICGTRLREAADSFAHYLKSKDKNELIAALEKQSSYFFLQKVLFIIGICGTALMLFIYLIVIFALVTSG